MRPLRVAIIDSGCRDMKYVNRLFRFYKSSLFVNDKVGHGTLIAKMIRRKNPDTDIQMLGVEDPEHGLISQSAVKEALEYIKETDFDLVNMSFILKQDQVGKGIEELITSIHNTRRTIFIGASGNHKVGDNFDVKEGGIYMRVDKMERMFPSNLKAVISVATVANMRKEYADYYRKDLRCNKGSSFSCARLTGEFIKNVRERSIDIDWLRESPTKDRIGGNVF